MRYAATAVALVTLVILAANLAAVAVRVATSMP